MKYFLTMLISLASFGTQASDLGSASLQIYGDDSAGFSQIQVNDDGTKLTGVGVSTVYLERQQNGYKGFDLGRPFNIVCDETSCTDNGSTQMNFKVTRTEEGYKLDGTLNYVSVHATVTDKMISLDAVGFSTNIEFQLKGSGDGNYSGEGSSNASSEFKMMISTQGTLSGLKDPATFIVFAVSPFVQQ